MNKTHAVIWNASRACWTVASECARRRGKSGVPGSRLAVAALAAAGLAALAPPALAGPTGGKVTHGNATIWQSATDTVINQNSAKAVIDWQSFNVNNNERVTFNQLTPNDMTLNYVSAPAAPSIIRGRIDSLGKVFLVNPNGILFTATSQVNVGSLVASTRSLDPDAFMNNASGTFAFNGGQADTNRVDNYGAINAKSGGDIVLLGAQAHNYGTLQADGGTVALGAGQTFTVRLGNGPLNLEVTAPSTSAQATNSGVIRANGGQVVLRALNSAAGNPYTAVVNHTGVIEAKSLTNKTGRIVLDGGNNGLVQVAGLLNANALGTWGNGGNVEVSGKQVNVRLGTQVDTRASNGGTGTFTVRSGAVNVENSAAVALPTFHTDTLSSVLSTTNVALHSTTGDVQVNAPIAWNSGNSLTLDARHGGGGKLAVNGALSASGNLAELNLAADTRIDINDRITMSGSNSRLSLATTTPAANAGPHMAATANYYLGGSPGQAVVTLSGTGAGFTSNGVQYAVIQNLSQLQAMNGNLNGYYVLGGDLRGAGTYLQSIGGAQGVFRGSFEGLGHQISGLTVGGGDANVGLFSASAGVIRDLKLDAISVNSSQPNLRPMSIGTLVGLNTGRISNVQVGNTTLYGSGYQANATGGLVGTNLGGTVENSRFSGRVYAGAQTHTLGGLVGANVNNGNTEAVITGSASEGIVSGGLQRNEFGGIGGLVGANRGGRIADSSSTATVTAGTAYLNTGGLVGLNENGTLERVRSAGAVSGNSQGSVGGLVGRSVGGAITDASSSGRVSSGLGSHTGGLVGENTSAVSQAEASGEVIAYNGASTGGLVGLNGAGGALVNVKASGIVRDTGTASSIGGLVGINAMNATIDNGEATGQLVSAAASSANTRVGGLAGHNAGSISYSASRVLDVRAGNNASAGGLVGFNQGTIIASSSNSRVQAGAYSNVGGIAGQNTGEILTGMASGSVSAGNYSALGGVAGINHMNGRIAYSSSTGPVIGAYNCASNGSYCYASTGATLGGLAGVNYGEIDQSISAGRIDYRSNAGQLYGGLVGMNYGIMRGNAAQGPAAQLPAAGVNYGVMEPPYFHY